MKNSQKYNLVVLFFLLIHIVAIFLFFFPLKEFLYRGPVISDDYAFHAYNCFASTNFFRDNNSLSGYDPYFMGGYLNGAIYINAIALKVFVIFFQLLGLDIWIAFKLFCIFTFLLFPLLIYKSVLNFGLSRSTAVISFGISVLYWHLGPLINPMVKFGMFGYVFNTSLVVYASSLFFRWLNNHKIIDFLFFSIISGLAFMVHPLFSFTMFVVFLAYLLILKDRFNLSVWVMLILCFGFVWVTNSFWIRDLFKYSYLKGISGTYFQSRGMISIIGDFFYKNGLGIRNLIIILGIFGSFKIKNNQTLSKIFLSIFFLFFILAYFGSYLNFTKELQPRRFIVQGVVFLLIPAAFILKEYLKKINSSNIKKVILGLLVFSILFSPTAVPSLEWFVRGRHIYSDYPQMGKKLIEFINKKTSTQGRILIQDSSAHLYYGSHFLSLLPLYTKREYIGGPKPDIFHKFHEKIDFVDDELLRRDFGSYSQEELVDICRAYNIQWIAVHSERIKKNLDSMSSFKPIGNVEWLKFYKVSLIPSYFFEGNAEKISADYDQINISRIHSYPLILKYHWVDGLRSADAYISPVKILGFPFEFIKVIPRNTDRVKITFQN